jgi:hypothetical protein
MQIGIDMCDLDVFLYGMETSPKSKLNANVKIPKWLVIQVFAFLLMALRFPFRTKSPTTQKTSMNFTHILCSHALRTAQGICYSSRIHPYPKSLTATPPGGGDRPRACERELVVISDPQGSYPYLRKEVTITTSFSSNIKIGIHR